MGVSLKNKYRNEYIGFIHQFFHLIPELTVLENVALPKMIIWKSKKESYIDFKHLNLKKNDSIEFFKKINKIKGISKNLKNLIIEK